MKRSPIRRRRVSDPAHREATKLAARSACLLCGSAGTCVPAHFPRHRGSGGRWPDPWARSRWVPLCGEPGACHDLIDSRVGGVNDEACQKREELRRLVLHRAETEWWVKP